MVRSAVAAIAFWLAACGASAAQTPARETLPRETLTVFAAGAVKAAMAEIFERFEADGSARIVAHYDTVGALRDRALGGEAVDIVLLSTQAIAAIETQGRLVGGTRMAVGRTGIGLAGRLGSAQRIRTAEAFRAVLAAAPSIGYADPARGATAGTHFSKLLAELGLAETLKSRLKLYPFGVETIAAVAKGELEIGVSQATEIVAHPNEVAFLGLFPDPYNLWTSYEAAALADTAATRRLLAALAAPEAQAAFARIGFAAPN
jgi:molybdate transport system substrate-binding protein